MLSLFIKPYNLVTRTRLPYRVCSAEVPRNKNHGISSENRHVWSIGMHRLPGASFTIFFLMVVRLASGGSGELQESNFSTAVATPPPRRIEIGPTRGCFNIRANISWRSLWKFIETFITTFLVTERAMPLDPTVSDCT